MRAISRKILTIGALALLLMAPGRALAQANNFFELATALANASAPIAISTAVTTQLVAAPAGALQSIHVMHADVVAAGTGNIQFVYGTGALCATGQGNVTGNYNLTAQTGFAAGGGFGAIWTIPAGNALCAVTSQAVGMAGSVAYRVY